MRLHTQLFIVILGKWTLVFERLVFEWKIIMIKLKLLIKQFCMRAKDEIFKHCDVVRFYYFSLS